MFAEVFTLANLSWFGMYPLLLILDNNQFFFLLALLNCIMGLVIGIRTNNWIKGLLVCMSMVILGLEMNHTPVPVINSLRGQNIESVSRLVYFLSSTFLGYTAGLLIPRKWQLGHTYKPWVYRRVFVLALGYGLVFWLFNYLPLAARWRFILVFSSFVLCSLVLVRGMKEQVIRSLMLYVAAVFTLLQNFEFLYRVMFTSSKIMSINARPF